MVECRTVFYLARKTSLCERALKKSFSEIELDMSDISFAADRGSLCNALTEAFTECNIVFVIGGLGFGDERDVKSIVSRLIKSSCVDDCKKLKNHTGDDGYIIRADSQLLVLLPDEPEQIEAIMQGAITGYIKIRGNARA